MYYKTAINLWRRMPFSEEEKQPWTLHTFIFFWITMSDFQFNIHIKQSHVSFFVSQLSLKTYFTVYSCCVGHLLFWYGPGILLYNHNAEGLWYTNRTLQDFSSDLSRQIATLEPRSMYNLVVLYLCVYPLWFCKN